MGIGTSGGTGEVMTPISGEVDGLSAAFAHLAPGGERDEPPGVFLAMAGDPASSVFLVRSGVVKLVARDAEGAETLVGLAFPGDIVGEVAALTGGEHPVDAVTVTRCTLVCADARRLIDLLGRGGMRALAVALAARLGSLYEMTSERAGGEVTGKLAGRLLDLAERIGTESADGIDMELPVNQADLGMLAGMCRESACKTLRRFKEEGLLDYRGRRLRIYRRDLLDRIRCGTAR